MLDSFYAFVEIRSSPFWDGTRRRLAVTDVSVQPIGSTFKGLRARSDNFLPTFREIGTNFKGLRASSDNFLPTFRKIGPIFKGLK